MISPLPFVLIGLIGFSTTAGAQVPSRAACSTAVPGSAAASVTPRAALGASIGILDSAALAPFAGHTLSEALTARLPGVSVMRSSGVTGTGSRIRMRGPSGILVTQEPVLFIDGIRADGELQSITLQAGGQAPSRLDDIPVDDVECIYVLRGPAATARYGTDAAGGVIHVVTRRASGDSTRIRAFVEGGTTTDAGDYPANFGTGATPATGSCTRSSAALGRCVPGPLRTWSPLDANSPFRSAPLVHAGARATVVAGPRWSLGANGSGLVNDGAMRKNEYRRYTAGANGGFHRDSVLTVRADAWFMGGRTNIPQVGPFIYSILNGALLGSSFDDPDRRGYRYVPLSVLEEFDSSQDLERLGGVARVDWKPRGWLSVHAVAGREDSRAQDEQFDPGIQMSQLPRVDPPRFKFVGERRAQRTSASTSAAATYGGAGARFTTEVSLDYLAETNRLTTRLFDATGQSPDQSSSWRSADATTKGVTVRQAFASSDRRFIEGGIRYDVLDRQVIDLEKPTYPFVSVAWDVGRESFFPTGRLVSSLRLRSAYGESGDSRPYDAALSLAFSAPSGGDPSPSQPVERTREFESGVDIGMFSGRVMVDATYFTKHTTDALFNGITPPSNGGPPTTVTPTASWRNRGVELGVHARLVDASALTADLAITYTKLKNEVSSLGQQPSQVGTWYRIATRQPLFVTWGQQFRVVDANGDGVIVPAEIFSDTGFRYLGSPVPTRELGLLPSIVIRRAVRIGAVIDYRGGFRSVNLTGRLRCNAVCADLYVPNVSLMDQARAIDPSKALAGWIEDASFVRWRELSVAWALPAAWSSRIGARSSSLVLLGRNLLTRTDYTGLDPEAASTGQANIDQEDVFTLPLARTISLRIDLGW